MNLSLEAIPRAECFPPQRHRWNTNEEIAALLLARREEWLSKEVRIRPKSGSLMLYSRKRVRYRRDGYCWKKRKDGKTTREDHMKLKVQGTECIYGCYVHSAVLPTFHRRCYWLLQNPDIVLVHYLNVPFSDDNKLAAPALHCDSRRDWTKDELLQELRPMFFSEHEPEQLSTAETIESIVQQLMTKQRKKATEETTTDIKKEKPIKINNKPTIVKQEVKPPPPPNVQLVQINQPPPQQQQSKVLVSPSQPSLIFNLSQFQNGSGLLILNPNQTTTTTTPSEGVALLYSRPEEKKGSPKKEQKVDPNPMDFIENDLATPDEDFGLEAFDMLAEFTNFDDWNSFPPYAKKSLNLVDFSPEWSFTDGGAKVLLVGPFFSSQQYSVLFDGIETPSTLITSGVLRCFTPAHDAGFVTLQVASQGVVVSNAIIFEFREPQRELDAFSVEENVLKFCVLERLDILETLTANKTRPPAQLAFEEKLVATCDQLMRSPWLPLDSSLSSRALRGGSSLADMSLLHLAAALGSSLLIRALLKWKHENPSLALDFEVDAFSCDRNECTPLMWAAARGHRDASLLLYQWNRAAINLCDNQGASALHVARRKGFTALVDEIERLEREAEQSSRGGSKRASASLHEERRHLVKCRSLELAECGKAASNPALWSKGGENNERVLALAEQIIAAMPARIKAASREEELSECSTPTSSPTSSSSCLQSPSNAESTADFCEFFRASDKILEFSSLTLSDVEQRELYEAAKVIQTAYRTYKGRKSQEEEKAAILIQSYYRRYKEYVHYRRYKHYTRCKQTAVIQTQFRNAELFSRNERQMTR